MPHVNHGTAADKDSNCALCTIAAIVGTNTAEIAKILSMTDQSDDSLAKAFKAGALSGVEQRAKVIGSMKDLIKQMKGFKKAPVTVSQEGGGDVYKGLAGAKTWMAAKKTGTQFAVWGAMNGVIPGAGAHWNYAEKTASGVEFRDYQDNDSATNAVKTGADFHPPRTKRPPPFPYDGFIVIAFEPS